MRDDTLLRLRATDAGFDRELPPDGEWLRFSAAGNLTTLWIAGDGRTHSVAAGPASVAAEVGPLYLVEHASSALPTGAAAAWTCVGDAALDALCRRLAVLGHVLPDQPLQRFEAEVARVLADQPGERTTERTAEVRQRVGQQQFRDALLKYWSGRCPITGVRDTELLRASHAKPWADSSDAERLDVHNGILLSALWDAAFDAGLVSFAIDGSTLFSSALGARARRALEASAIEPKLQVVAPQRTYLLWHREHVFRG
jgi:hypothetical protein